MATTTKPDTMLMLRRSYQLVSSGRGDRSEIRDTARNGLVVYTGTYRQCVAEARRLGLWYS